MTDHTPHSEEEAKAGEDLLIAIGHVVTNFQGIEYAACEIFLSFFPPPTHDVVACAYHAIRMIESRLTVISALIKHYCEPDVIDEWDRLFKCIRKRAAVRNAAAHGLACMIGVAPNRKWALSPSPYDIDEFTGSCELNDYYTAKELNENADAMTQLTKQLSAFENRLANDSKLRAKLAAQQNVAQNTARHPVFLLERLPKQ